MVIRLGCSGKRFSHRGLLAAATGRSAVLEGIRKLEDQGIGSIKSVISPRTTIVLEPVKGTPELLIHPQKHLKNRGGRSGYTEKSGRIHRECSSLRFYLTNWYFRILCV